MKNETFTSNLHTTKNFVLPNLLLFSSGTKNGYIKPRFLVPVAIWKNKGVFCHMLNDFSEYEMNLASLFYGTYYPKYGFA